MSKIVDIRIELAKGLSKEMAEKIRDAMKEIYSYEVEIVPSDNLFKLLGMRMAIHFVNGYLRAIQDIK